MAQSCSQSDPRRTPQTMEEPERENVESNVTAHHAVETAKQKEHRMSMPRRKEKARRAARAAAEVHARLM